MVKVTLEHVTLDKEYVLFEIPSEVTQLLPPEWKLKVKV